MLSAEEREGGRQVAEVSGQGQGPVCLFRVNPTADPIVTDLQS